MTVGELVNIFLRLAMADKADDSEFLFGSGEEGVDPFPITGVSLDEDGDVCLESDSCAVQGLSARELADAVRDFEPGRTIYFVRVDGNRERLLFNIKDGGTKDRDSEDLRIIPAERLRGALEGHDADAVLHFESGTINFTVNSVYEDSRGCICLESNEIMELADYPAGLLLEELSAVPDETGVYFYDDDSKEYYGIYVDEARTDDKGDVWIKVR